MVWRSSVTPSSMSSSQPSSYLIHLRLYIAPTFTERKHLIETVLHTYDAAKHKTKIKNKKKQCVIAQASPVWPPVFGAKLSTTIVNYFRCSQPNKIKSPDRDPVHPCICGRLWEIKPFVVFPWNSVEQILMTSITAGMSFVKIGLVSHTSLKVVNEFLSVLSISGRFWWHSIQQLCT